MTDRDALLAAILAQPKEDTPRLVYADWLEENGQPERAEFIRLQIELALLAVTIAQLGGEEKIRERLNNRTLRVMSPTLVEIYETRLHQWYELRRRERELIDSHGYSWFPAQQYGLLWGVTNEPLSDGDRRQHITFSRGFISAITCTWDSWRTHAAAILRAQPVERVRLTTRPDGDWARVSWTLPDQVCVQVDGKEYICRDLHADTIMAAVWPGIEFELPAGGYAPGQLEMQRPEATETEPGVFDVRYPFTARPR